MISIFKFAYEQRNKENWQFELQDPYIERERVTIIFKLKGARHTREENSFWQSWNTFIEIYSQWMARPCYGILFPTLLSESKRFFESRRELRPIPSIDPLWPLNFEDIKDPDFIKSCPLEFWRGTGLMLPKDALLSGSSDTPFDMESCWKGVCQPLTLYTQGEPCASPSPGVRVYCILLGEKAESRDASLLCFLGGGSGSIPVLDMLAEDGVLVPMVGFLALDMIAPEVLRPWNTLDPELSLGEHIEFIETPPRRLVGVGVPVQVIPSIDDDALWPCIMACAACSFRAVLRSSVSWGRRPLGSWEKLHLEPSLQNPCRHR